MVKFGFAIAGLLSGAILSLVGFDADAAQQTEGAITGLRAFYSGVPILGTLIAMYVMRDYDVTEERANEIRAELDKRKAKPVASTSSYYPSGQLMSLIDGDVELDLASDIPFDSKSGAEIQKLFSTSLQHGIHGLCFSPYTEGQDIGDILTESQIRKRMEIIEPFTQWVRSFSCTDGNQFIPQVAREKGLKTMVGAWIGKDKARNEKEIEGLIALGKAGMVDIAAVGNEVLLRNELSEAEILEYMQRVKAALPGIPVGYVDAYYQLIQRPELVAACDVILTNCYPFWEGSDIQMAAGYLKRMYQLTKEVSGGKQVIITETGWPNKGSKREAAEPSSVNAMKYFINVSKWQQENDLPLFYFTSFDESWKLHHEGDVGAGWGIWDQNEHLKYE
jgi:GPH family glycoside/pentoside/hexuronide:cation symporter